MIVSKGLIPSINSGSSLNLSKNDIISFFDIPILKPYLIDPYNEETE